MKFDNTKITFPLEDAAIDTYGNVQLCVLPPTVRYPDNLLKLGLTKVTAETTTSLSDSWNHDIVFRQHWVIFGGFTFRIQGCVRSY